MLVAKHLAHRSTPDQIFRRKFNKTYAYYTKHYATLLLPFIKAMIEDRQPRKFDTSAFNIDAVSLGRLVYRAIQWLSDNEEPNGDLLFSRFQASTKVAISKEKHCVYLMWKYPALIILDEAHCVKNIDSTQSRIIQAYNDIREDNHYSLYASATLWTRVIETKCFAVATRLEW